MCGFAGFYDLRSPSVEGRLNVVRKMGAAIRHRGPDGVGWWTDEDSCISMVHQRLAIVDLSEAGHQPMISYSRRFVIVFNGEIYNHLELRRMLEESGKLRCPWRGHSDTETLLAGIEVWGLQATLTRSVGMFAVALWDREERSLVLARDRLGEKPLYFGWQGGTLLFGSELKALKAHPAFRNEIDRNSIALQLRSNCLPGSSTIYSGIKKLTPGHILYLTSTALAGDAGFEAIQSFPYWSLSKVVEQGKSDPFQGSDSDAISALDGLMRSAVAGQMVADVPVGAFLSGGIDSSTIVAMMQAQSSRPVKTFTIGFNEDGYNEAVHAKEVARHLGTDHTELYISPDQALDVIPLLPSLYDEPFSDSSQIPTYLVSQLTRSHVTVSLSGDAGDELFGGYSRYGNVAKIWSTQQAIPFVCRRGIENIIHSISVSGWDALARPFKGLLPPRMRNVGDKLYKVADLFGPRSRLDFYKRFIGHWTDSENIVVGASLGPIGGDVENNLGVDIDFIELMMLCDSLNYLPDDILVKVDRAAMGVSLETRVPMLDHRVVEFAWQLPLSMKHRSGVGKWILRQVLDRYVPRTLIDRPKMGFGVPIGDWLRGPLRDWAETLLDESKLRQQGYFRPAPIRQKWLEHIEGQRNWQYLLWDVLMFQAWLEEQRV